jgi:dephospho-CoA kinase
MITIGITGTLGAGKGTVVDYLVNQKGFRHFSVRAFLLEKIRELGMPENRDSMFELGNRLRAEHGASYAVDQLYLRAQASGSNAVIESIRTTGEIASLRSKGGFTLLAVDADPHIRYERIVLRGSETDHVSFETFISNETRESVSGDPAIPNLQACIVLADSIVMNNGTVEELYRKVEEVLKF